MPNLQLSLPEFMGIVRKGDYVILDTETTGLKKPAEICQIAVIDNYGRVLIDRLVKPVMGIPLDASRIHHILNEHIANSPSWVEVLPQIMAHISGKNVIVYNATYDRMMFHLSDEAWQLPRRNYASESNWICAITAFSEYRGEWSDYFGNYRWWKLADACRYMDVVISDEHDAQGDCALT